MLIRFLQKLLVCAFLVFFTHAYSDVEYKPFRVGVLSIDKNLDWQKPIGAYNPAGWVYDFKNNTLVGVVDNQWVVSYSLQKLKPLWWYKNESKVQVSSPVQIFQNSVVFSYSDGSVVKLNLDDGKLMWKVNLDSLSFKLFGYAENKIFVLTYNQRLYAIDLNSGVVLWIYDHGLEDNMIIRSLSAPVVLSNTVISGMASGDVVGLDIFSGKKLWQYDAVKDVGDSKFYDVVGNLSIVDSDKFIFSRNDGFVALVVINGDQVTPLWSKVLPSITASVLLNNKYYVGCLNGDIYAISPTSGDIIWTQKTYKTIAFIYPLENIVYTISTFGRIYSLFSYNGFVRWYDDIEGYVHTPPFLVSDVLYISTAYNNIYGYKIGY